MSDISIQLASQFVFVVIQTIKVMQQQSNMSPCQSRRKGYYAKQLANFENKRPEFKRSKKRQIKKQNKTTCKEARQRKKHYVNSLQMQRNQLVKQNERLRSEIDMLKEHLEQTKTTSLKGQADQRAKALVTQFRQLVIALKMEKKQSISRSLSVLRDKFGISGRQRKKWLDDSILRTIELSMPLHFRVLIENVQDPYKFFELLGGSQDMRTFRLHFDETDRALLRQIKPKIKKAKQNFNRYTFKYLRIYSKLHSVMTELTRYAQKAQTIIDTIQDKLDPIFVGNLLVNLDSRRCTSQQIKQIYPLNFYRELPEENEYLMECSLLDSKDFIEPEDEFAFGHFFDD